MLQINDSFLDHEIYMVDTHGFQSHSRTTFSNHPTQKKLKKDKVKIKLKKRT